MPFLWECLDKVLYNLLDGMIAGGTVDSLPEELVTVKEDAFDEFAGVGDDVDKWEESVARGGEPELPSPVRIVAMEQGSRDALHVESREEEGCRKPDGLDVLFNLGLGVEVVDLFEPSFRDCVSWSSI
jgi:hypothetical protein